MGVVVVVSLPYAVLGPGFFREDWQALRNARVLGTWHAAANDADGSRPLAGPVYAVVFGVLGHSPLAIYALLTAVNVAVAVLVFLVGRAFLHRHAAATIAVVWAVLPTHSSTSRWASTTHATAALAFLLWGALLLVRDRRRSVVPWPAGAAFLVAALLYEAVLVPAAAMFVVHFATAPRRRWHVVAPAFLLVPAGLWAVIRSPKPAPRLVRLTDIVSSNVGWGINDAEPWWRILQLLVLGGVAIAAARVALPGFRTNTGWPERTALVGLVVIAVGALPFAGYAQDIDFVAQGDRANMVSAIGAALLIVGVASMLPRRACVVALIGVGVLCVPTRLQQDADWARTAEEVNQVLGHLDARLPARPTGTVRLGVHPIAHGGVEGLENSWDASLALQATRVDPRWRVEFVYERERLGPNGFDIDGIVDVQ